MLRDLRNNNWIEQKARFVPASTEERAAVTELVEKAARGDYEAFGELYDLFNERIFRYIFYQVRDKMIAEDITEEVFFKAWKAIGSSRGRGQTFSPWLYRIAHNQVVDQFRANPRLVSLNENESGDISDPSQELEKKHELHDLLRSIAGLPEGQQQVVVLKFIESMSNREIGQITGKSEGAIRILQMRALATLRKQYSGETD